MSPRISLASSGHRFCSRKHKLCRHKDKGVLTHTTCAFAVILVCAPATKLRRSCMYIWESCSCRGKSFGTSPLFSFGLFASHVKETVCEGSQLGLHPSPRPGCSCLPSCHLLPACVIVRCLESSAWHGGENRCMLLAELQGECATSAVHAVF